VIQIGKSNCKIQPKLFVALHEEHVEMSDSFGYIVGLFVSGALNISLLTLLYLVCSKRNKITKVRDSVTKITEIYTKFVYTTDFFI